MELRQAQDTFALRLYEWSQSDFLRELETGCTLLSMIGQNNRRIGGFVSWNKMLSSSERRKLAQALTISSHNNARRLKGEVINEEVNYWKEQKHNQTTVYMDKLPPLTTSDTSLPTFRPVDVDACISILTDSLSPVLGKVSKRRSAVRCWRMVGDWKIVTDFTYERWHRNLTCMHQFIRKDDKSGIPKPEDGPGSCPRSLLFCWGVYNRTVVAVESQQDSEPMAKAMATFAEHFVLQAPALFSGLDIQSQDLA